MKERIKHYVDVCVEHIIKNVAWSVVVYVASIIALNLPQIISVIFAFEYEWLMILASILSILSLPVLGVGIWLWRKACKAKSNNTNDRHVAEEVAEADPPTVHENEVISEKPEGILDEIDFKKIVISMVINNHNDIRYDMKYDGTVNCDSLEEFPKQLSWSGSTYIKTELARCNFDAHIEDNIEHREQSPYLLNIVFDENVSRGEHIKFTTNTYVSDGNKDMLRVSSFCVKYPIEELTLKLTAPTGLVCRVKFNCYMDSARQVKLWQSRKVAIDENDGKKMYTVSVPAPAAWRYYCMEWDFTEQYYQA